MLPEKPLIQLTCQMEQVIYPRAPFHFDGTFHKPSNFPSSDLAYEAGHFWQSVRFEGQLFGAHYENLGTTEEPAIRLQLYAADAICEPRARRLVDELAFRYDWMSDLRAFYQADWHDDLLEPLIERWRGVRPNSNTNLYEYLVIAVVLQNATARRTVQMLENLFGRYGSRISFEGRVLSAFWEPDAIRQAAEEDLRALKVGYRAKTLKRQAEIFVSGGLDEAYLRREPSPALKKELLKIYGIGPASVWYLMYGVFKRYDAFEYIAPWEQKIFSRLLFEAEWVDAQQILAEVDRRWGRWKMLAAHLLFEDLFWRRQNEPIGWLEELIRL